ncbi:putative serine/threonine-protein kinase IKS1 [Candida viswanathii]|uniref:Putative serine/threonine-protein kinase IKS1 n=1 Tax=Candida viswanathii TaxID=5486 RepID=A0A367XS58_9ASCO|nr:putative serine/threonine-protein kinase IKS1 [Candida viswanathii]
MSVIPYNNGNKDIVYHNPNDGVLVVHDRQENTISLVSTMTSETQTENKNRTRTSSQTFTTDQFTHAPGMTKCPNCGFAWTEYPNNTTRRRSSQSASGLFNISLPKEYLSQGFMHTDYFKLLGKIPVNEERAPKPSIKSSALPDGVFNQGYFKRFFKKIDPFTLGSGAHAQVYKVNHVLNDINLGTYAVKRINVGDQFEFLDQVLNEVLILYELSTTAANENNLIRYNHVWLEMGELDDLSAYFLPASLLSDKAGPTTVPYVFILQQYCDGGHLEDLINKNFTVEENLTWKQKVELERKKRQAGKSGEAAQKQLKWLTGFEIWKFFHDVANGVNYLHKNGILHRDMKPSNCLLDVKYQRFDNSTQKFSTLEEFESKVFDLPKVLVSDFGEGKFIEKRHSIALEKMTDRQGNTGTLEFIAPELWLYSNDPALGNDSKKFFNDFTYQSDIYSLGLILCYLCVGKLPFSGIVRDENDPQEARNKILDWYYTLTSECFSEWFEQQIAQRDGQVDECMRDFEKLIYIMIKGEDANHGDSVEARIGSKEVLVHLNEIKWKRFIESDAPRTRTYSEEASSKSELAVPGETMTLYNPILSEIAVLDEDKDVLLDDEEEDLEFEREFDADHINLTEDESEEDTTQPHIDGIGMSQNEYLQLSMFATVPFYCFELLLLEYLSYFSPSFPKSMLKIGIFISIAVDIGIVERTKVRTAIFVLTSIALSIFLAYELGRPAV